MRQPHAIGQRVLVVASLPDSLANLRGPLLRAMTQAGHQVTACAAIHDPLAGSLVGDIAGTLAQLGVSYRPVPLDRAGLNPWQDTRTIAALYQVMRQVRPDILFAYTAKAVIYSTMAARLARVPRCYALISGLGSQRGRWITRGSGKVRLLSALYRHALARSRTVFFQNPDDRALFLNARLVPDASRTALVNGSGVDLAHFAPAPPVASPPTFLLIARLLGEKGIREYALAARRVRARHPEARFRLAGSHDPHPDAVTEIELRGWGADGTLQYLGVLRDVRPAIAEAGVYVLPSYYGEGVPRTTLEAMAMARPILTADTPGCRETVIEGENGYLVPPRDPEALADAMARFVQRPERIAPMGARSREMAEARFDVREVNAVMLRAMGLA